MLLQLSQTIAFCPPPPCPQLPQKNFTPLSMSMGHAYVFIGYSIPYVVLYIPMTVQ